MTKSGKSDTFFTFLQGLGHDAVRVSEVMTPNASDREIVERADSSVSVLF
jgi:hypothetical protein